MGNDESHFNVSVGSDGPSHKTVSTNHNLFEEKGEPKRYQTEVLSLTSLTARPNRLTMYFQCADPSFYHIRIVQKKKNSIRSKLCLNNGFYLACTRLLRTLKVKLWMFYTCRHCFLVCNSCRHPHFPLNGVKKYLT